MKLGIAIQETWDFFHEINADLEAHHQTSLFERRVFDLPIFNTRINNRFLHRDLERFLQANDVVFFEWASELLALATHLPKTCGIVTRLHRYEMYQWVDKINWEAVDRLIVVSEAKRQEFNLKFPEQSDKVVVIPESISLTKFTPHTKKFEGDIGILCHLRPRKRVYELILAFSELSKQNPELHLHIGGGEASGFLEYAEALQVLVRKLNLQDQITFYGHVSNAKLWYSTVDIFISNSYSEGLQVSPMEAIASGCYCLSHHWDGADELLPEEYLFFTEGELIQKIQQYCNAPAEEKEKLKLKQRNRVVDHFDADKIKTQIRHIIEEVGEIKR